MDNMVDKEWRQVNKHPERRDTNDNLWSEPSEINKCRMQRFELDFKGDILSPFFFNGLTILRGLTELYETGFGQNTCSFKHSLNTLCLSPIFTTLNRISKLAVDASKQCFLINSNGPSRRCAPRNS